MHRVGLFLLYAALAWADLAALWKKAPRQELAVFGALWLLALGLGLALQQKIPVLSLNLVVENAIRAIMGGGG